MACEKLIDAKKAIAQGKSPALEKQREERRLTAVKTFGEVTEKWLAGADVGAASIATFVPKDRALSLLEIRLLHLNDRQDDARLLAKHR